MEEKSLDALAFALQKKAYEAMKDAKKEMPCGAWKHYRSIHASIFLESVAEINKHFGTTYSTVPARIEEYFDTSHPVKY